MFSYFISNNEKMYQVAEYFGDLAEDLDNLIESGVEHPLAIPARDWLYEVWSELDSQSILGPAPCSFYQVTDPDTFALKNGFSNWNYHCLADLADVFRLGTY